MNKLFKLKEWLTIEEAALHLTSVMGESVLEKDIYRLGLDGHLKLSVNFVNHAKARIGKFISEAEVVWEERFNLQYFNKAYDNVPHVKKYTRSLKIDEGRYLDFEKKIHTIDGVWDLTLIGGERLDVEHLYLSLASGPEVSLMNLDGAFVERKNVIAQLMESFDKNEYQPGSKAREEQLEDHIERNEIPKAKATKLRQQFKKDRSKYLDRKAAQDSNENYYQLSGLPDDSLLVVKTSALIEFTNSLEASSMAEKPLNTKERYTLLTIIAALCGNCGIDYNKRGITSEIQQLMETSGTPISDETIRKVLKQINEAVDSRTS